MKNVIVALAVLLILTATLSAGEVSKKSETTIPPEDTFVKVDVMPEQVKQVRPEYPEVAKKSGIEGDVYIQAYIDKAGKVLKAKALKCTHKDVGFEEAAVKAAYAGEFSPAKQDGQPVGVWVSYKVTFRLDDKPEKK